MASRASATEIENLSHRERQLRHRFVFVTILCNGGFESLSHRNAFITLLRNGGFENLSHRNHREREPQPPRTRASATRTNSSGTETLKTNRTNSSTETLETNRTKSSGTEVLEVQSMLIFCPDPIISPNLLPLTLKGGLREIIWRENSKAKQLIPLCLVPPA